MVQTRTYGQCHQRHQARRP